MLEFADLFFIDLEESPGFPDLAVANFWKRSDLMLKWEIRCFGIWNLVRNIGNRIFGISEIGVSECLDKFNLVKNGSGFCVPTAPKHMG